MEEIEWMFDYWTERQESLAALTGIDGKGNEFVATCQYCMGEFINIKGIEEL